MGRGRDNGQDDQQTPNATKSWFGGLFSTSKKTASTGQSRARNTAALTPRIGTVQGLQPASATTNQSATRAAVGDNGGSDRRRVDRAAAATQLVSYSSTTATVGGATSSTASSAWRRSTPRRQIQSTSTLSQKKPSSRKRKERFRPDGWHLVPSNAPSNAPSSKKARQDYSSFQASLEHALQTSPAPGFANVRPMPPRMVGNVQHWNSEGSVIPVRRRWSANRSPNTQDAGTMVLAERPNKRQKHVQFADVPDNEASTRQDGMPSEGARATASFSTMPDDEDHYVRLLENTASGSPMPRPTGRNAVPGPMLRASEYIVSPEHLERTEPTTANLDLQLRSTMDPATAQAEREREAARNNQRQASATNDDEVEEDVDVNANESEEQATQGKRSKPYDAPWTCSNCQTSNPATASKCSKCKATRMTGSWGGLFSNHKETKWKCLSCGNLQHDDSLQQCPSCGVARGETGENSRSGSAAGAPSSSAATSQGTESTDATQGATQGVTSSLAPGSNASTGISFGAPSRDAASAAAPSAAITTGDTDSTTTGFSFGAPTQDATPTAQFGVPASRDGSNMSPAPTFGASQASTSTTTAPSAPPTGFKFSASPGGGVSFGVNNAKSPSGEGNDGDKTADAKPRAALFGAPTSTFASTGPSGSEAASSPTAGFPFSKPATAAPQPSSTESSTPAPLSIGTGGGALGGFASASSHSEPTSTAAPFQFTAGRPVAQPTDSSSNKRDRDSSSEQRSKSARRGDDTTEGLQPAASQTVNTNDTSTTANPSLSASSTSFSTVISASTGNDGVVRTETGSSTTGASATATPAPFMFGRNRSAEAPQPTTTFDSSTLPTSDQSVQNTAASGTFGVPPAATTTASASIATPAETPQAQAGVSLFSGQSSAPPSAQLTSGQPFGSGTGAVGSVGVSAAVTSQTTATFGISETQTWAASGGTSSSFSNPTPSFNGGSTASSSSQAANFGSTAAPSTQTFNGGSTMAFKAAPSSSSSNASLFAAPAAFGAAPQAVSTVSQGFGHPSNPAGFGQPSTVPGFGPAAQASSLASQSTGSTSQFGSTASSGGTMHPQPQSQMALPTGTFSMGQPPAPRTNKHGRRIVRAKRPTRGDGQA